MFFIIFPTRKRQYSYSITQDEEVLSLSNTVLLAYNQTLDKQKFAYSALAKREAPIFCFWIYIYFPDVGVPTISSSCSKTLSETIFKPNTMFYEALMWSPIRWQHKTQHVKAFKSNCMELFSKQNCAGG